MDPSITWLSLPLCWVPSCCKLSKVNLFPYQTFPINLFSSEIYCPQSFPVFVTELFVIVHVQCQCLKRNYFFSDIYSSAFAVFFPRSISFTLQLSLLISSDKRFPQSFPAFHMTNVSVSKHTVYLLKKEISTFFSNTLCFQGHFLPW